MICGSQREIDQASVVNIFNDKRMHVGLHGGDDAPRQADGADPQRKITATGPGVTQPLAIDVHPQTRRQPQPIRKRPGHIYRTAQRQPFCTVVDGPYAVLRTPSKTQAAGSVRCGNAIGATDRRVVPVHAATVDTTGVYRQRRIRRTAYGDIANDA